MVLVHILLVKDGTTVSVRLTVKKRFCIEICHSYVPDKNS